MTTSDGGVLGSKQIFGSQLRRHAFNVVLLAEGFANAALDQARFDAAADAFVQRLRTTAPFDRLQAGINVFRVNVWSRDRGADDPAKGVSRRTYFDASFGGAGTQRLLVCNQATALTTAVTHVPEVDLTLVVVNSTEYGGSGGSAATYSLHPDALEIALHEAGHSAFALADEYDADPGGPVQHPPGEPSAVNVTTRPRKEDPVGSLQTLKWRWAWTPGTKVPTTVANAACGPNTAPSPVPTGTVGAFAGADRYNCGAYRPEHDCKMRHLGQPFCRVCRQQITDRITSLTQLRARTRTPIGIVARDARHLDVFAVASDGRTMNDWWDPEQGWSGWTQVAGGTASAGGATGSPVSALTRFGTEVSVYTVGPDNQVASAFWNPFAGWSGWTPLPGTTCRSGATVTPLARFPQHIDLFTTRSDGQVVSTWWEQASGWSSWFAVTNGVASPNAPVTALSRHTNHVDLYMVGSDNRVWTATWSPFVGWSSWSWVGGLVCRAGSTVSAVARHPNHVDLVATAPDGTIMTAWWEPFSGWSAWFGVSGGVASPGSPVTALSRRSDQVDLFVLGTDHRVYTVQWNQAGGWGTWSDVRGGQGQRGGHVAAVSREPAQLDLVVIGADSTPWTTSRRDGAGWVDWTQLAVT